MLHSEDDAQLVQRLVTQDAKALSLLYDRYAKVMYALAYKIVGSVEEAEEVVMDVFAKAWKVAASYDPTRGRVDTWLFLMARSRSLDFLRKRQRRMKLQDATQDEARVNLKPSVSAPDEVLLHVDRRDRILSALAQIPVEQRQVIELSYYRGYSQSEIAEKMSISLGTVKTRARLGLKKLRGLLAVDND